MPKEVKLSYIFTCTTCNCKAYQDTHYTEYAEIDKNFLPQKWGRLVYNAKVFYYCPDCLRTMTGNVLGN